ncbi:MAG: EamA family transporter [Deltaproteobacteria bacterium]|nr:EamA family transporter [Deltaproteobacteria bacterium]
MKHEATASPAAAMRSDRLLAGALHVLGASLMFAMMGALVKEATAELPNAVVVFFRNALALVILVPFFLRAAGPATLKTRHFRRHLVRSLAGLGSMYLFFYTLGRLPLAEAVLLSYTSPIFIPLVARLWIGEPLSHVVYRAVFLGFAGVVLILRPGPGVLRPAALLGLGSGALMAVAMVSIRRMSDTEPPGRIVFYFSLLATVVSSVPLTWSWQTPSPRATTVLVGIALLAVLGQMLLTRGYSLAPAGRVGPFSYANIVFAALLGWLFWSETLSPLTGLGTLLVCGAGMLTAAHGHRQTGVPVPSAPGNLHALGRENGRKQNAGRHRLR